MKLIKIILKNIRSYQDQEINFPEGSLLLSGDIGSGKTSILLAIEYALFGLQPGQRGSSLLRNNKNVGEVSLLIEVQGKEVLIERKVKRSNKTVSNDYAAITIDGIKYESSITEVKTKILNILGYPQEFLKKNNILYKYTVYTPQEQVKQIILEDSETRLNVLRHIFGVEKYKRIRENTQVLISKLKEESKLLQFEVASLEKDKETLAKTNMNLEELKNKLPEQTSFLEQIVSLRKNIELESLELEKEIKEKERIDREIDKTKILITSKKEFLVSIYKEIEDLKSTISENNENFSQEELDELESKIRVKKEEIEKLNSSYFQAISNFNSLQNEIEESNKKRSKIFSIDLCPTCLQNVSENHKHNIANEIDNNLSKVNKAISEIASLKEKAYNGIQSSKNLLSELESRKNHLLILSSKTEFVEKSKKKLESLSKSKEFTEKDISLLIKHLDSLKEETLKYSVLEIKYKSKKEELRKSFIEEKKAEITLAEFRKEVDMVKKYISDLSNSMSLKENSVKKLSSINELLDWLSNQFLNLIDYTERNIMWRLRKEFSRLFGKWFTLLVGEGFEVQLDESFTPLVMQGGVEMEYSFLSGGERTAVALAYRLALNQIINSIFSTIKTKQIIILDEPTEGLSETQIEKMRDIFQEINTSQLIIVSHEQKIEGFVDKVLRVKKIGNTSVVSELSEKLIDSPELPKDLNTSPDLPE